MDIDAENEIKRLNGEIRGLLQHLEFTMSRVEQLSRAYEELEKRHTNLGVRVITLEERSHAGEPK